jgi:dihydrofolate reductase
LPADLAWFKRQTVGKPIIMGRKTFDSIGKALPHRLNIVLSRQTDWSAPDGVIVVPDWATAMQKAQASLSHEQTEIMVIGGGTLYALALPLATRLYLTLVEAEPAGDTLFPEWDRNDWSCIFQQDHPAVGTNDPAFSTMIFERQSSQSQDCQENLVT